MIKQINPGDIISYIEMCTQEGLSLQRGMNFRVNGGHSIFLMSVRKGAPYNDKVEDEGKTLIYEGHDAQKGWVKYPKDEDQPMTSPNGSLTDNGKFFNAAKSFKEKNNQAELVKVYEKIKDGIWVYNGLFKLVDAWVEKSNNRKVFKFKLEITVDTILQKVASLKTIKELEHNRIIPTSIKLEVWKRDKGKCVQCGSTDNLHFDHILPFVKGGTSLKAENIQLLCARHNLQKRDKII
ncbi:MAG: HNH endonuclease [Chitinophaga sp.]|jgi:SAD/SRA domain/HNH endonuclease|nr:HNH endonuclease [Chitinophaga sp.]